MNDACYVKRLIIFFANRFVVAIVGAVVGSQIEPARARQCHVKVIQIVPGTLSGRPGTFKRVPNGSWERLGSVSGASRGVLGAPRERPGSPQRRPGTPERAPRTVREHTDAAKIDSKAGLGSFPSSSASQAAWASGPGGRPRRPRRLACALRLARSAATSGPACARSPSRFQLDRHRWVTSL